MQVDSFDHVINSASNYLVTSGSVKAQDYFNSGVLVMNLNLLRGEKENLMQAVKFVGERPQLLYLDQEILNLLYSKSYLKLPTRFNSFVRESRRRSEKINRKVYHFAGGALGDDINDAFNRLWLNCFIKTPFFDVDSIGRLFTDFKKIHAGLKYSLVNLSAAMSGKTRVFFATPQNIDGLKRFFSIRADEEIIPLENQASLQKLLDAMKNSQGKKIFIIMLPNFPYQILIQAGFVYGRDFLNGLEFLSEEQGVQMNSYSPIHAM